MDLTMDELKRLLLDESVLIDASPWFFVVRRDFLPKIKHRIEILLKDNLAWTIAGVEEVPVIPVNNAPRPFGNEFGRAGAEFSL